MYDGLLNLQYGEWFVNVHVCACLCMSMNVCAFLCMSVHVCACFLVCLYCMLYVLFWFSSCELFVESFAICLDSSCFVVECYGVVLCLDRIFIALHMYGFS